ncbi:unknown protein [Azorhizobium caulinodans ORS 571]|uniref:Uncharacterized protein n=1 Tax=Azorhizobium caulinodans (strain ATCC 43989 / DSM 5975 / JCM 20966 / LMG 6465 / NBRC 14845 / NCIMB 13405 / ORS 571) TaxID=438753 RepID=A8HV69_AZOC5|nr:unknown protein [Azorhizobium caulinodans ORS 571]
MERVHDLGPALICTRFLFHAGHLSTSEQRRKSVVQERESSLARRIVFATSQAKGTRPSERNKR